MQIGGVTHKTIEGRVKINPTDLKNKRKLLRSGISSSALTVQIPKDKKPRHRRSPSHPHIYQVHKDPKDKKEILISHSTTCNSTSSVNSSSGNVNINNSNDEQHNNNVDDNNGNDNKEENEKNTSIPQESELSLLLKSDKSIDDNTQNNDDELLRALLSPKKEDSYGRNDLHLNIRSVHSDNSHFGLLSPKAISPKLINKFGFMEEDSSRENSKKDFEQTKKWLSLTKTWDLKKQHQKVIFNSRNLHSHAYS